MEPNSPVSLNQQLLEQVENLLNIGIALSAEHDRNRLLQMIVTEARRITNADGGTLYLREDNHLVFKTVQTQSLHINLGGDSEPVAIPPVPLKPENVSAYVALSGQTITIADVYQAEGFDFSGPRRYDQLTGYRTQSMMVVPLADHEKQVIGVLQLINAMDSNRQQVIPFAPYYQKVVECLASQAAIALTNAQLLRDIELLFNSFVAVMATAIDARTPYNANHTRRVALLAEAIALAIDASEETPWAGIQFGTNRINQLVMAGWLHDIGKVTTPLSVMNKATRLDRRLELVLQRFDYIYQQQQNEVLTAQLRCLQQGNPAAASLVEQEGQEALQAIKAARDLILTANDPATFVDQPLAEGMQQLGQQTYLDASGQVQPWLTAEELEQLTVRAGTLTSRERKIMEDHVAVTSQLLSKIPFTSKYQHVPHYAVLHHELLDGKGYPQGLKEEAIPLEGRILTMVDIFDALTAGDRPYKKALPVERALAILEAMVNEGKLDRELFSLFRQQRLWERLENATGDGS